MRKLSILLASVCVIAWGWDTDAGAGPVRISQIYAGGGENTEPLSPYGADFVELFNSGGSPVDVGGWLFAYGGSNPTSSFGCAGCTNPIPSGTTIGPCSYLLFQVSRAADGMGGALPAPDVVFSSLVDLQGTGVLALLNGGSPSGICVTGPTVEDLVGWTVSCFQTAPILGGVGHFEALFRLDGGMTSTGNNSADFVKASPAPRNSASPQNPTCVKTSAESSTWGRLRALYR